VKRIGLLLVAFASSLAAQDSTASTASPSTSLVDRAARTYRDARTVRATFEQTLTSSATGGIHPSRGEYFQSGSKFALRFSEPNGDAIVCDGTTLWLYLPSTAKGQVMKLPAQMAQGMDILSTLLSAPKNNYVAVRLRDEQIDAHATTVFALTPKRSDMPFTHATLWIGKSDGLVWQIEVIEQSGLQRHVRFSSVRTDVDLPAEAFMFSAPAGVKVLDQAALFGKKP
jgi:outer membrane lipoprotein carrier protein